MIYLVCPICKRRSESVVISLMIKATSYLRITAGRTGGLERSVASPIQTRDTSIQPSIIAAYSYTCVKCGKSSPASEWRYNVTCSNCGDRITRRPVADIEQLVHDHICLDTMNILCDDCWEHASHEYCPECRFRDDCPHS